MAEIVTISSSGMCDVIKIILAKEERQQAALSRLSDAASAVLMELLKTTAPLIYASESLFRAIWIQQALYREKMFSKIVTLLDYEMHETRLLWSIHKANEVSACFRELVEFDDRRLTFDHNLILRLTENLVAVFSPGKTRNRFSVSISDSVMPAYRRHALALIICNFVLSVLLYSLISGQDIDQSITLQTNGFGFLRLQIRHTIPVPMNDLDLSQLHDLTDILNGKLITESREGGFFAVWISFLPFA